MGRHDASAGAAALLRNALRTIEVPLGLLAAGVGWFLPWMALVVATATVAWSLRRHTPVRLALVAFAAIMASVALVHLVWIAIETPLVVSID